MKKLFIIFLIIPFFVDAQMHLDFSRNGKDVIRIDSIKVQPKRKNGFVHFKAKRRRAFEQVKVGNYLTIDVTELSENDSVVIHYEFLNTNMNYIDAFNRLLSSQLNIDEIQTPDTKEDQIKSKAEELKSKGVDVVELQALLKKYNIIYSQEQIIEIIEKVDFTKLSSNERLSYLDTTLIFTSFLSSDKDTLEKSDTIRIELAKCSNGRILSKTRQLLDTLEIDAGELLKKFDDEHKPGDLNYLERELWILDTIETLLLELNNPDTICTLLKSNVKTFAVGRIPTPYSFTGLGLIDARAVKFLPLQIQNFDNTLIYLRGYRDRVPIFDRKYLFHNKWGFKADVSVGFAGVKLTDNVYSLKLRPRSDTTFYEINFIPQKDSIVSIQDQNEIIENRLGKFYVGATILAHFYTRMSPRFNFGIGAGFTLTSDADINYLLGVSCILGKEQRIVLSSGLAVGQVNRISDLYEKGDLVPLSISEIPTRQVWSTGVFFAVTYNL